MTQHTDLIDRLRCFDRVTCNEAANALEAQAREIAELKAQLAATAKNAFEAMPHDIPLRMKREICVSAAWSGSMVSRMYTELRKAFTGEPYRANEDLDAALLEVERLRKDAERYQWLKERKSLDLRSDCSAWTSEDGKRFIASHFLAAGNTQFAALESLDETIDKAMKGQP